MRLLLPSAKSQVDWRNLSTRRLPGRFIFAACLGTGLGPAPTSVKAMAWGGQLLWLSVALAYWADANRESVASGAAVGVA